ncbi:MAG: cupin-like domain-containing protein [Gammaproteobacteria bacterium]|nr:cupin-like domain-containing protein [Gammaproteobacteria bacterium]MBT8109885.1 cupin-like domain-containing protein [Gammaproteobacteria bacterium]NND48542.1 cupin-like domain-containing protein [Woeseiaceae bacterium]NNL44587.1 cupin-like domain-containing protein [Woeseiaceae bacterium]
MAKSVRSIREWQNVDLETFQNEIVPGDQPAVLKSLVGKWPAVEEGLKSPAHICRYIKQFDSEKAANATVGAPSIKGRFFYRDDLQGFNFERKLVTVSTALDNLAALIDRPDSPAIAMQAIPVLDVLPGFEKENVLPLIDPTLAPRMWLGNRSTIATHYDIYSNIACVVAGRRRFTLFPPEQVANLYIGPLLATPGGSPISMVDLRQPDMSRYPRFKRALEVCQKADLEPGDALYIPILWWHSVESLGNLNVLVNYWWNDAKTAADSPFHSLLTSMLSISKLPADQRQIWRDFFDYFVFQTDSDPAAHLPNDIEDVLGSLTPEKRKQLKAWLSQQLLQ